MQYSEFVEIYEKLSETSKRLEKEKILADFLKILVKKGKAEYVYLLSGRVLPDYDTREFGISTQLVIKALSISYGVKAQDVINKFKKLGDFGKIAEELSEKRRQGVLFSSKLSVQKVFENLRKIVDITGKGTIEKKIGLVSELLGNASGKEAKYIIRTLLNDLKVGVAEGILRDAIAEAFFENKKDVVDKIEEAYDMVNDFAMVLEAASKGKKELEKIEIIPGRPMKVMLPVKTDKVEEAFRICGKPAALEYKYDGFRLVVSKHKKEIRLFTRRLEEVTRQFPDVIEAVKNYVKGESFILDAEGVGYDPKTKKYMPFQDISQRIKRKYDIEKLMNKLPVELDVFDIVYHNGKSLLNLPFSERRKIIEKIVKVQELKIKPSMQLIVDNEEKAEKFYKEALRVGEEGIMVKKLDAPYRQGRRVGYMVKIKPEVRDLDLVIVGAEYGTGKRAGWLTSYIVACKSGNKFLEVGMVSSGLKEKEEEGFSYIEMTKLLKPLVIESKGSLVRVKPKIIVAVTYQNIQKSPTYSSGFALRFPRITAYRPDKPLSEITALSEIEKEAKGK